MIKKYLIGGFKCFKTSTEFSFSRVNLLTGYNGRGKSSVFQSLLLLAQSVDKNSDIEHIEANGKYVSLGTYSDLLPENKMKISYDVTTDAGRHIVLAYDKQDNWSGKISKLKIDDRDYFESNKVFGSTGENDQQQVLNTTYPHDITDIFRNFYFISANRLGPTLYEEKSAVDKTNPLGIHGEHRLNVLAEDEHLLKKVATDVSSIMDGGEMGLKGAKDNLKIADVLDASSDDTVLSLFFKFAYTTKKIKAINVGFGYSYILPIITLINTAKNCTIFIENPEAHLHPKAQARLMRLICSIPKENNVQIFVETHSEHIINAVRLYTLKPEDGIELLYNDVYIYFFDKDYSIKCLSMDENAQIANWPKGFFDQQENDLSEILKYGLLKG